jgi:hypothetical protein
MRKKDCEYSSYNLLIILYCHGCKLNVFDVSLHYLSGENKGIVKNMFVGLHILNQDIFIKLFNLEFLIINIEKTEEVIKNEQSRNTGNIGYIRHRTKILGISFYCV